MLIGECCTLQVNGTNKELKLVRITLEEQVWTNIARSADGSEGLNFSALQKALSRVHDKLSGSHKVGPDGVLVNKSLS